MPISIGGWMGKNRRHQLGRQLGLSLLDRDERLRDPRRDLIVHAVEQLLELFAVPAQSGDFCVEDLPVAISTQGDRKSTGKGVSRGARKTSAICILEIRIDKWTAALFPAASRLARFSARAEIQMLEQGWVQ
jgi:hypothetical protein